MKKKINIGSIISSLLVAIIVLFAVIILGSKLLGFKQYVVVSPSMEPNYPVGSLIFVKSVEKEDLKVGEVITFYVTSETVATHRIVDIDEEGKYITKGDANDFNDEGHVSYVNVIGSPKVCIPEAGYVANFIQTPVGRFSSIAVLGVVAIIIFLPELFKKEEEKE